MNRVCQITTAHPRYDIRIFFKEASSLAERYETHLIVSDGKGDEVRNNVHIHDVGVKTASRLIRFGKIVFLTYSKAIELNCDVYQFHDPDFLLAAVLLRWRGKTVIYDSHEDAPRQMLTKEYLGRFSKLVAFTFEKIENWSARRFSAIVAATPCISERFQKLNKLVVNVNNYPLLSEVSNEVTPKTQPKIAYVGAITKDKGVGELIDALDHMSVQLELAGTFESETFRKQNEAKPGWKKVIYHGNLNRKEVLELLQRCSAGMVLFNPTPNYIYALPIKMFEYMAAGLPVVCSNFPLWKEIVEGNQCGICADPLNSLDVAEKTMLLLSDLRVAGTLGLQGKNAIEQKFNWEIEKEKLFDLYKRLT